MRKLILRNYQAPGDILMLTAAVRDLHLTFPGEFVTDVRTSGRALWENNPYLTPLSEHDPDVEVVDCRYPLMDEANRLPYHFIHGFRLFLSDSLGREIRPQEFKGDIHLSDAERAMPCQVDELLGGSGTRFWIVVCGGRTDCTVKWWDPERFQAVVDHFRGRLLFVQCASLGVGYVHWPLRGAVDLAGKTRVREFVRLMHHADGVICPVTFAMHLAAAVETRPGRALNRPCVVIAGGREPAHFVSYPFHQVLHTAGGLRCCETGGCWKSRVVPRGDGDPRDEMLCVRPVRSDSGRTLPRCMDLIRAKDVIAAMERFLECEDSADEGTPAECESAADGRGGEP